MGAQKAVAVVAAVSASLGLIRYERRPSSYNAEAFGGFLERLSAQLGGRPAAMLLDNCAIHHAKATIAKMQRLDIKPLWNVPYRADLNGIEAVWAIAKQHFRSMQLQRMMGNLDLSFDECVDRAMDLVQPDSVRSCCRRGARAIMKA